MTTGLKPHRCETCKDNSCEFHKSKKSISYMGSPVTGIVHDFTLQKGCASHSDFQSERDMLKEKYRQLMAASINNENPGWVQIADIEKILNPFDTIIPDIENLQEFPFRNCSKKDNKFREQGSEPK